MIRLASASPRRSALLTQIGVPHSIAIANLDESERAHEPPHEYVKRIATAKAQAIWSQDRTLPVLAADTTVVLDGLMFGKPRDKAHALEMLVKLSGRTHEVLTAVALATMEGIELRLNTSGVRFRTLTEAECEAYWESGEPRDKAGAYAIQGLGAVFIESVTGSYSGVMGLPLYETAELLRAAGVAYWCKMGP